MPPAQQTSDFLTAPFVFVGVFVLAYLSFANCCQRAYGDVEVRGLV